MTESITVLTIFLVTVHYVVQISLPENKKEYQYLINLVQFFLTKQNIYKTPN